MRWPSPCISRGQIDCFNFGDPFFDKFAEITNEFDSVIAPPIVIFDQRVMDKKAKIIKRYFDANLVTKGERLGDGGGLSSTHEFTHQRRGHVSSRIRRRRSSRCAMGSRPYTLGDVFRHCCSRYSDIW